jgi:excisionase family DNA binding protein
MTSVPVLLTTGEAAEMLRVDPATMRRMVERGDIRAIRLPGSGYLRIPREVIDEILAGGTTPGTAATA